MSLPIISKSAASLEDTEAQKDEMCHYVCAMELAHFCGVPCCHEPDLQQTYMNLQHLGSVCLNVMHLTVET